MRSFLIVLAVCGLIALGLERLYAYQHGGFCIQKVLSSLDENTAEVLPPDISVLLEQPFRFLGSGGTCFAFLGQDGKTVLKLFKHPRSLFFRFVFPLPLDLLRLDHLLTKEKRHHHKQLPFLFNSCKIAEEKLKEETGLLYLSLKKNPKIPHVVTLIDRWGFPHKLPLALAEFALQKKAIPLFAHLQKLLLRGHIQQCKAAIDAILAQMTQRARQGVADRDPNLCINFGYCEEQAIEFDIGSFFPSTSPTPFALARELFFCTMQLQKWLEKECPELLHYIHEQIHDAI